ICGLTEFEFVSRKERQDAPSLRKYLSWNIISIFRKSLAVKYSELVIVPKLDSILWIKITVNGQSKITIIELILRMLVLSKYDPLSKLVCRIVDSHSC